jgi:DNA-binding Lrp family transcriptional regulator
MSSGGKIDDIDAKILKMLLFESRATFTEMSRECGISVVAVRARCKQLKKKGIINGETIQLNPFSLGWECILDLLITSAVEYEREVVQELRKKPYTVFVHGGFGAYNIDALIFLPTINLLGEVIKEIEALSHVRQVSTLIWADLTGAVFPQNLTVLSPKAALGQKSFGSFS